MTSCKHATKRTPVCWECRNPEKMRAYKTAYKKRNPDHWRADYEKHKDRFDANRKRWRSENPERSREVCRVYQRNFTPEQRAKRSARMMARYYMCPDHAKDNAKASRARSKGSVVVMRVSLEEVWVRDGGLCGICGKPIPLGEAHLDHIVPASKCGPHVAYNCQAAHQACNSRKLNRSSLRVLPRVEIPFSDLVGCWGGLP